jgi:hypothetical protein
VGILLGFAPWIVYWVLVGNVPFATAVLVALAVAVLSFVIGRVRGVPGRTLEIGAIATFLVLTALTFTLDQSFMERWIQPLSNAGIFLVALISALVGRPFVREIAEADQPKEVVESDLFKKITSLLTWIWIAAFAGMTVSSAIPPIVYGDATILDTKTPLSFVCYWVVPFSLLGLAALASRVLPERMAPPPEDIVRKTTQDHLRRVRRGRDRPVDVPGDRTCQPRSRPGQGALRHQDRQQGRPVGRRRDAGVVAVDLQGARQETLTRFPDTP